MDKITVKQMTAKGLHHLEAGEENQDAITGGRSGRYQVISLADGVSACRKAAAGAKTAAQAVTGLLLKKGRVFFELPEEKSAELILSHILRELRERAERDAADLTEYSSTVASVLFDRKTKKLLCLNLGDGLILGETGERSVVLSMPSDSTSGCCVTTTKKAVSMFSVRVYDAAAFESVVICSDGAWRQMYSKNRLKPQVAAMLAGSDYGELENYLFEQENPDDCSFIAFRIRNTDGRESA